MGATYTRQSTYTEGDIIQASDTNDEFDQLLAAFAASTGHTHDGTTGEGGPITTLAGHSITIGLGTAGTDITLTFDGETSDGVLKWMEDEDYFEFSDDILIASTEKLQFRDTAIYINSSTDGQLDLVADTEIQIAATTVDINGAVDVSGNLSVGGNLDVTGTFDLSDSNFTNAGDIQLDSISGDADSNTSIAFSGSDVITITTGGETQVTFNNGSILPTTDDDVDLGSSSFEFKDGYFDGTLHADAINFNGTAITATAAELNIMDGVTATAAELNTLDGITAVVGELNALDLGSTAVGTAIASKAVVLDANKDYTGIRNLTLTGDLTIGGDDLTMGTNTSGHLLIADGTNFNPTAVGDLSEISTAADDDVFIAVDTSGGGLKKITRSTIIAGTGVAGNISNIVEDTTPQLGGNLDTNSHNILIDDAHFIADENGNEQIIFQTTSSAVNQFDVTNAATGNAPELSATGGDTNIDLKLTPKGTGQVVIDGNVGIESGVIDLKNAGSQSYIRFYCESSNAHYAQLQAPAHSAFGGNITLTLPATTDTLVGKTTTDTLTNKTLTSPVLNTATVGTSIVPASADGATLGSASAEFSDLFLADGATIKLGNDQDVTITHVADTGILLSGTNVIQFNDASQNIGAPSGTVLDINATDEIELNATLVDVNANLDVSGTYTGGGLMTTGGNIVIPDAGNIGSASDTDAIAIASNGVVTFSQAVSGTSADFDGGVTIDDITIDGTEIDLSSGDLTVDVAGDIILDADGGDFKFQDGGTEILRITNSSSDVVIRPVVDAKDLIFQQRDGTEVARIEDNGTFNVVTDKLAINGTAVTSTAAELNILDGATATASEINLLDGDTSVGSSITLADADGFIVNDNGTMKTIPASDVKTYAAGSSASKGFAIAMAIVFG